MIRVPNLFRANPAWSTAVYLQDTLTLPPMGRPDHLITTKRPLRLPNQPHTIADPFIRTWNNRLFVFYETQVADDFGRIEAAELTDGQLKPLGVVLEEPFHLSYPAVLQEGETAFMVPESQGSNQLRLYRFLDFPNKLVFERTLLAGTLADPSPINLGGIWYIFATSERGLELYFTDDLVSGEVRPHPASPITSDPRFSRCGGMPFSMDGEWIRPAQDCSGRYGANLHLMSIIELSPVAYREAPRQLAVLKSSDRWNAQGGHHVSVAEFRGRIALAVDGQADDYLYQKVLNRAFIALTGRQRR